MPVLFRKGSSSFADSQSPDEIRSRTVRGAATTYVGQGLNVILGFVSTAILARLLTPQDFGLVAMTAVFRGFVGMFKDAGLSTATVQQDRISHEQISTLFWANFLLTSAMTCILFLGAPLIAAFFKEPRLTGVTQGIAIAFFVGGAGIQHRALLQRQMRFGALVVMDIGALLSGIATGAFMAAVGYGYWSLVGMSIATALAGTLITCAMMPWLPGRPRRGVGTRRMFRFGSDILTLNIVHYFATQADTILIGRVWGPTVLAFYDKAYRMLLLPIRQINGPMNSVIVPALSRLHGDPERLNRFFLRAIELVTALSIPAVVGLCLFADEFVLLWLGSQWSECAHLFRMLTIAALMNAMIYPATWLMISQGNTRILKWVGIGTAVLYVSSFLIGLPYGAEGVAIAYSVATLINFLPVWWMATQNTPISLWKVIRSFYPPVFAAVCAAIVGYLLLQTHIDGLESHMIAIVAAPAYGGTYALILLLIFRRWNIFMNVLRELRGSKAKAQDGGDSGVTPRPERGDTSSAVSVRR